MAKKTIAREEPLSEITLRKYEKPGTLSERDLVRKFCLSIGLLQPGDSRDVMVDIVHVFIMARKKQEWLSSEDIEKQVTSLRKKNQLPLFGIAASNIRRQMKRLKDMYLVEKHANKYRIVEFESFSTLFEEKIVQFHLKSIVDRVKEYCDVLK